MISSLLSLKYVDEVNNFIGIIIGQFVCYCQGKEKPPVQDNPLYDLNNIKGYETGEPINRII